MDIQSLVVSAVPSVKAADHIHVAEAASKNVDVPRNVPVQKPPLEEKPSTEKLQKAVEHINQSFKQRETAVQFTIDRETKRNVVKMVDSNTGEVIRQIPSEVTLAISKAIDEQLKKGVLLNQEV